MKRPLNALAAGAAFLFCSAQVTEAESLQELVASGYQVAWQGYASIATCVQLGPYLFVCDQYTYEYPYHYGDVALVVSAVIYKGQTLQISYLCLIEQGKEAPCFRGSLYRR